MHVHVRMDGRRAESRGDLGLMGLASILLVDGAHRGRAARVVGHP